MSYDLLPPSPNDNNNFIVRFIEEVADVIPDALAKPYLDYVKVKEQGRIISEKIKSDENVRLKVLETMQVLAKEGKLTPECFQMLCTMFTMVYSNTN